MATVRLTAMAVKAAKPSSDGGRADLWDTETRGLGLRAGSRRKSWIFKYSIRGRQRKATLGEYPALSLKDARAKADEYRASVSKGVDPVEQEARARRTAELERTFGEVADLYIEQHAKPKKRSWREDERMLGTYFGAWRDLPASGIARDQMSERLHRIAKENGGIQANRCLSCVRRMYSWALNAGKVACVNPAAGLEPPAPENRRERVYSDDELRALWGAFGEDSESWGGTIYRLALLTVQRLGEVSGMRWGELDLEKRIWTIPSHRMKNKTPHMVPLPPAAVEVLSAISEQGRVAEFVFPSHMGGHVRNLGKAALRVKARSGVSDFEAHVLRHTAATWIADAFGPFHASRVLGHVEKTTTSIYTHTQYLKEKREALEAWERHALSIVEGGNVVQLRTK